ncbi:MAG: hypothetical protein J0H09_11485 [Burkholderiales bacterium]|nr:hypothetical protein [Burkholderiales bacterium]
MKTPAIATMRRTVLTGPYTWNRDLIPLDECARRMQHVRSRMQASGLDLLLVYGDALHSGMLTWLSNFNPKLHWGLGVLAFDAPETLVVPGGTRDLPAARAMSYDWQVEPFAGLQALLTRMLPAGTDDHGHRRVGLLESDQWCEPALRATKQALQALGAEAIEISDAELAIETRPREKALIDASRHIVEGCRKVFEARWRDTRQAAEAVRDAELWARTNGAHDVRILCSDEDGLVLAPLQTWSDATTRRVVAYLACQHLGYWADAFITLEETPSPLYAATAALLRSRQEHLRRNASVSGPHSPEAETYSPYRLHPMVQRTPGSMHGLELRAIDTASAHPASPALMNLYAGLTDGTQGVILSGLP